MPIRATVIVPAYNAAATIASCLRALVAQSFPRADYEIIVVDDCSTDGTAELAEEVTGIVVCRGPHMGAASARNRGVAVAHGGIVLFTDADCEPQETWIEEMLAPFEDAGCAGAKGTYRTRQREPVARFVQLEYEEKYARMRRAAAIDFVDTYSAGYRRDVFLGNGGFDESFPSAAVEDQEFSFRLAQRGYKMVFAPQAMVYHQHPASVLAYARRKFRIGYWKVRVHRRHPGKVWKDSHTPATLKLQVACFLGLAAALCATPFFSWAWVLALAALLGIGFTAVPLVMFIARRDKATAWIAPGMILVRAAALGLGLIAGVGGEISRSTRLKRGLDIIGASVGLIVFAPLMLLIAIWVKLDSPGPVLFVQSRSGKGGHPFRMFKFRTMVNGAETMLDGVIAGSALQPPVFKIPNDPRVTRVGRWLRRFSLDELPQFFNVLKGEMSLVGPRPEETSITAFYSPWHTRRLAVKPGMTGPMQIAGRGTLSLDERVRLELTYIENYSLWQDLCLLSKTLPAVIWGRGSY